MGAQWGCRAACQDSYQTRAAHTSLRRAQQRTDVPFLLSQRQRSGTRNSPVTLNANLRDANTQQTSWVPGRENPSLQGFLMGVQPDGSPSSWGARQCLSAQALWPLCTRGRPGAWLHSEPQQQGPARCVGELSSRMEPPAGREDAPALLLLCLASNACDRRLCEVSSRRATLVAPGMLVPLGFCGFRDNTCSLSSASVGRPIGDNSSDARLWESRPGGCDRETHRTNTLHPPPAVAAVARRAGSQHGEEPDRWV